MQHPNTELRFVNPQVGYGVFATTFIPAGTIVYARCSLDIRISPSSPLLADPAYRDLILKYAYTDPNGDFIICWDIGKYVNHCCHASAVSTGYGFDIAVRDLQPGDEITNDYAQFSFDEEMDLFCHYPDCRKKFTPQDFDRLHPDWDAQVKSALQKFAEVPQPLQQYLDPQTASDLQRYLATGEGYRSVRSLRPW
ncbi:MAG TPA: SET domain-containing protein [Anaerolineales bacterium]|nr:SET domain-containing protein [Anaerolineales bacterium]